MVSTQRLTSLAYNIVDGRSDNDKLSPNVKPYIVKYSAAVIIHVCTDGTVTTLNFYRSLGF